MSTTNLLPCPFCGQQPQIHRIGALQVRIECPCGIARTQKVYRFSQEWLEELMIKEWNTRAPISGAHH